MNKIIILALTMCIAFAGYGQGTSSLTPYKADFTKKTNGADTTVNTDTTYLVFMNADIRGFQFQANITNTKVSGTVGGSVIMQGSADFTNWFTLKNYSSVVVGVTDTVTLTNTASQIFTYGLHSVDFRYVRWRVISSGTQSATPTGTIYWNPPLVKNLN